MDSFNRFTLEENIPQEGDHIKAYTDRGEYVGMVRDGKVATDDQREGPAVGVLCEVGEIAKWRYATSFDY